MKDSRFRPAIAVMWLILPATALGQHGGHGGGFGGGFGHGGYGPGGFHHGGYGRGGFGPGGFGGGFGGVFFGGGWSPFFFPAPFMPAAVVGGPFMGGPGFAPMGPQPMFMGSPFASPILPLPPAPQFQRGFLPGRDFWWGRPAAPPAKPTVTASAKAFSADYLARGDRFFRAKDYRRARDRFARSARFDPNSADPLVHEAQIDILQGHYEDAAERIRQALSNDGNWVFNAPDIRAMYLEPGDFDKRIADLEAHVQANPEDRDAWFALGFEKYLSGKSRQASDIFMRLTDRRGDATLFLMLQASTPREQARR